LSEGRRVVITGLGVVSPVGLNVKDSWDSILAGKSGIKPLTNIEGIERYTTQFGGAILDFDISQYISKKDARRMDPFIHYGIAAGCQAMEDAGLEVTEENAERIGVAIGSGIGGISGIEAGHNAYLGGGPRKISPFFVPGNIINMISGNLSIKYGLKGPNIAIATACTTGTHSIGQAARMIAFGDADAMIAGGAEKCTSETGLGGFAAAKALSTRNDDPTIASRPWDKDRDGFVLSDGAGVVVLEEYEMAKARGADIYAEVVGFGMSADAYHITSPSKGGEGAARCMNTAFKDAGINAEQVDYVNAHGTSTNAGDVAETQALKLSFGQYAKQIAISSTKSMTGHMLGAAGGAEAVFAALSIRDQVAPATINLTNPDPECDLDFVPGDARQMKMDIVVSNSFGFGGTNGSIILKKV